MHDDWGRQEPTIMKGYNTVQLNTLDKALEFAGALSRELEGEKTWRMYRVFASLTSDRFEALIAFLIWKARGDNLKSLLERRDRVESQNPPRHTRPHFG